MNTNIRFKINNFRFAGRKIVFTYCLILVMGLAVFGQSEQTSQNVEPKNEDSTNQKSALKPVLTDYKGISIGSTRDFVKEKLGKPKIDDKDGFYYIISKNEQVQIRLDDNQKVSIIAVTYSEKDENIPTYEEVFGKEVPMVTRPDGGIYNLVRYPEAGIWVAYSKTAGDEPTVTVTIQKL